MRYSALALDSKYDRNVLAFLSHRYYTNIYLNEKQYKLGKSDSGITLKFIRTDALAPTRLIAEVPETNPLFNASLYHWNIYNLQDITDREIQTAPITEALKHENWTVE